uniref:Uncharacterized protein n=1 Tax=Anguilla anguilla TaxID=7936 RepID=A0A0E9TKD5_ANGAN
MHRGVMEYSSLNGLRMTPLSDLPFIRVTMAIHSRVV